MRRTIVTTSLLGLALTGTGGVLALVSATIVAPLFLLALVALLGGLLASLVAAVVTFRARRRSLPRGPMELYVEPGPGHRLRRLRVTPQTRPNLRASAWLLAVLVALAVALQALIALARPSLGSPRFGVFVAAAALVIPLSTASTARSCRRRHRRRRRHGAVRPDWFDDKE